MTELRRDRFFEPAHRLPALTRNFLGGQYEGLPADLVSQIRGVRSFNDFVSPGEYVEGAGYDDWARTQIGAAASDSAAQNGLISQGSVGYASPGCLEVYTGTGGADTGVLVKRNRAALPGGAYRYRNRNLLACGFRFVARDLADPNTLTGDVSVGWMDFDATGFWDVATSPNGRLAAASGGPSNGCWATMRPDRTIDLEIGTWVAPSATPVYQAKADVVTIGAIGAGSGEGHTVVVPSLWTDVVCLVEHIRGVDSPSVIRGSGRTRVFVNGSLALDVSDFAIGGNLAPFVSVVSGNLLGSVALVDYFWSWCSRSDYTGE